MSIEQRFATSSDGTSIPYFLVLPEGFEANSNTPTLLYGYGGFEISLTPGYSATVGHSWLARGGAYVIANIRGGGEYGPRWHQAALKENRQVAYDDFIAVAEDLIERGVTSPRPPRHSRRLERRLADWRDAHAAAGPVERGGGAGAAARHEALQQAAGGRFLDGPNTAIPIPRIGHTYVNIRLTTTSGAMSTIRRYSSRRPPETTACTRATRGRWSRG